MTALATISRNDFVLSIADRRSSMIINGQAAVKDEKVNKHVYFCIGTFRGAVTFCGFAEWTGPDKKTYKTDEVIGEVLENLAKIEALAKSELQLNAVNIGVILNEIMKQLEYHAAWIEKHYSYKGPKFTLHFAGYTGMVAEPWMALITEQTTLPDWSEDGGQMHGPTVGRFRSTFAVRCRPTVLLDGSFTNHAQPTQDTEKKVLELLQVEKIKPFHVANYVVSKFREVSVVDTSVGDRVSGIIMPAHGFLDTGIWSRPSEAPIGMMPRMVFPNGTLWRPSEVPLDFQNFFPGRQRPYGLMYRALLDKSVAKKHRRLVEKIRHGKPCFTIMEMIGYTFYGEKLYEGLDEDET